MSTDRNNPRRAFLTRNHPEGRFLAKVLSATLGDLLIVVEGSGQGTLKKLKAQLRRHVRKSWFQALVYLLGLPALAWLEARSQKKISVLLEDDGTMPSCVDGSLPSGVEVISLDDLNHPQAVTRLKEAGITSALVYGTSILKSDSLGVLGKVLNIHMGLVPRYRGSKSEFWALSRNDFENIGWTLHECTLKLDGGGIVAQGKVAPPSSSPSECRAKSLKSLAQELEKLWRDHETGRRTATPQEQVGELFSTPSILDRWRFWRKTGQWV